MFNYFFVSDKKARTWSQQENCIINNARKNRLQQYNDDEKETGVAEIRVNLTKDLIRAEVIVFELVSDVYNKTKKVISVVGLGDDTFLGL